MDQSIGFSEEEYLFTAGMHVVLFRLVDINIQEDQDVRMFSFFGEICIYSEYDLVCLFGDKYI